ncbi:histidinol-phosphate transaminase [Dehalobacterium formicoaceticum]|uniref:Histidinol-phosphate aminotransferase n=1 Tax=Dehalobacterium formicoaceticum TaxID=51515 RepID=A0ABT1XZQ1_9FIRM|nr:histidinol-phosphate transaminase [Dehalobacterium formicoaceticum]MCR6544097.1 histidinol-phosphate transaminase [Dehalobacterium formicoaceticum]
MENKAEINLARKGIEKLIAYVPGKPVEEVAREYGITEIVKLASNENPLGTSPKALAAMQQILPSVYMYPEGSSPALRERIAANYGIESDMVIFGNGADNILLLIAQAFINEGDEVIIGDPTFSVYETTTRIMGGRVLKVPLKNFTYDLAGIKGKISEKTKIIYICNPNNPTGTIVYQDEVAEFMASVPENCIVVFDEAYAEFAQKTNFPQTIQLVKEQRNVLIVRTFSKVYGLAGVRVGYAVGPKHLLGVLNKVVEPFPVNKVAQAGALGALEDQEFLDEVMRVTEVGKKYLYQEFTKMKMTYAPTFTNFVLVDFKRDAEVITKKLLERGIIIRPGQIWQLPTCARITIGTMAQNEKLIAALKEIIKE